MASRGSSAERLAGLSVRVEPCDTPLRPADAASREAGARDRRAAGGREVVTVENLAGLASGETYLVPHGALLTDAARDEARRRGVRLVDALFRARELSLSPGARPRVAIGSDHGGFALKRDVAAWLAELGYEALDVGTHDEAACDYPKFARAVAEAVAEKRCVLGVVIDGAGIGSAMAANKVPGVLAANCWDERTARNAREHNLANVLTLGAGGLTRDRAHDVLRAFLATPLGEGRHARRVALIHDILPAPSAAHTLEPRS